MNPIPAGVPVSKGLIRECRRTARYIERSLHEMTPEQQRIALNARMAAYAAQQRSFSGNATFQRACFEDLAAFAALGLHD